MADASARSRADKHSAPDVIMCALLLYGDPYVTTHTVPNLAVSQARSPELPSALLVDLQEPPRLAGLGTGGRGSDSASSVPHPVALMSPFLQRTVALTMRTAGFLSCPSVPLRLLSVSQSPPGCSAGDRIFEHTLFPTEKSPLLTNLSPASKDVSFVLPVKVAVSSFSQHLATFSFVTRLCSALLEKQTQCS